MVAIYQIWFLATRRIPCFAPWAIPRYNGWLILPLATASPWIRHEMSKTLIFVFCDTILMLQQLLSIFVQSNEIRWICQLEWLETSAFISCNKCGVQWTPHLEASRCGVLGIFLDTIATLGMNDRTGGMIGIIIGYSVTNRWVCRLGCVYQCRTRGSWLPSPFPASSAPSSSCPPPAHHNAQTPQTCPLFIVKFHTFLSYV